MAMPHTAKGPPGSLPAGLRLFGFRRDYFLATLVGRLQAAPARVASPQVNRLSKPPPTLFTGTTQPGRPSEQAVSIRSWVAVWASHLAPDTLQVEVAFLEAMALVYLA